MATEPPPPATPPQTDRQGETTRPATPAAEQQRGGEDPPAPEARRATARGQSHRATESAEARTSGKTGPPVRPGSNAKTTRSTRRGPRGPTRTRLTQTHRPPPPPPTEREGEGASPDGGNHPARRHTKQGRGDIWGNEGRGRRTREALTVCLLRNSSRRLSQRSDPTEY